MTVPTGKGRASVLARVLSRAAGLGLAFGAGAFGWAGDRHAAELRALMSTPVRGERRWTGTAELFSPKVPMTDGNGAPVTMGDGSRRVTRFEYFEKGEQLVSRFGTPAKTELFRRRAGLYRYWSQEKDGCRGSSTRIPYRRPGLPDDESFMESAPLDHRRASDFETVPERTADLILGLMKTTRCTRRNLGGGVREFTLTDEKRTGAQRMRARVTFAGAGGTLRPRQVFLRHDDAGSTTAEYFYSSDGRTPRKVVYSGLFSLDGRPPIVYSRTTYTISPSNAARQRSLFADPPGCRIQFIEDWNKLEEVEPLEKEGRIPLRRDGSSGVGVPATLFVGVAALARVGVSPHRKQRA